MSITNKELCRFKYKCSQLERGFDYVSSRNFRRHAKCDEDGISCHPKYLRPTSIITPYGLPTARSVLVCPQAGPGNTCTSGCTYCGKVTQLSRQQEWRDGRFNTLYGALTGATVQGSELMDDLPYHVDFDPCGTPVPKQFDIHVLPITKLPLDEAIYRETWRLQSLLDSAKTPQRVQDQILKSLFGPARAKTADDMSGLCLGALLRHAGEAWTGGRHGEKALSTFGGLCNTFTEYGMPTTQRWRLCVGIGGHWHSAVVLSPSREDDYNLRTGVKCMCTGRDRPEDAPRWRLARDCPRCAERCPFDGCSVLRKNMVPFEYFPIGPMLAKLCSSRSVCHELLAMWRSNVDWFYKEFAVRNVYKEWWDGYRAAELSYFWDTKKDFELPIICRACYACYQSYPEKCAELLDPLNWDILTNEYDFHCTECGCRVKSAPTTSKGDPRNFALMAHWDGFQSAKTAHKSTWTVEVQILNAGCNTSIPPIPVLFIPPCDDDDIGRKKMQCLDAFLEPFMRDLQNIFVDGIELHYNYPMELIEPNSQLPSIIGERSVLRAMLVVFTGDHPAQCKFGGWNTSGLSACRHCKLQSAWVRQGSARLDGSVRYGQNRKQMRYPPQRRTMAEVREGARLMTRTSTLEAKKQISRSYGISAKTRALRLNDLYGFCLINDLVYDTMHILALCLFKKYCERLIEFTPRGKERLFEEALEEVTRRRPKGFDGRWPKKPFSRLGYFKAEEFTKFIMFCVPHLLFELKIGIETPMGTIGLLLVEIARLFYIKSREEGWTAENMIAGRLLLSSWRVRSEEAWGANGAILEHVAGSGEIFDGIERHGPHYAYWCYKFERLVSDYGRTRTNQKAMEITFSLHFARRFFTSISDFVWQDDDGLFPHQRVLSKVHNSLRVCRGHRREHKSRNIRTLGCPQWHSQCVSIVSSQTLGIELWEGMSQSVEHYECKDVVLLKGVGIGSNRLQFSKLGPSAILYLRQYWKDWAGRRFIPFAESDITDKCTPLRAVVWRKEVYRSGDSIVVLVDNASDATNPVNWKARVNKFFVHKFKDQMQVFFEAEWYKQIFEQDARGNNVFWDRDIYSQFTLLEKKLTVGYGNNCRPVSRILHKFFPIQRKKSQGMGHEIVALEIGDTLSRQLPRYIAAVPPYPEVRDIISAFRGTEDRTNDNTSLCVVRCVNVEPIDCSMSATNPNQNNKAEQRRSSFPNIDHSETSDSNPDEEEIENEIESEDGGSSLMNTRSISVNWLTLVVPRLQIPVYKASIIPEQDLSIDQIVELHTHLRVIKETTNGIPIRWQ